MLRNFVVSQIETILVDLQKRAVCVFTGTVRCIETLTKRARKNHVGFFRPLGIHIMTLLLTLRVIYNFS